MNTPLCQSVKKCGYQKLLNFANILIGPNILNKRIPMINRLHYLDNLRMFCLLFGVFLQAKRVGDFAISPYVTVSSDFFRMATYFLISGYFMALLLQNHATKHVLKTRLWVLTVPLIFGLSVINPITNSIASHYVEGSQPLTPIESIRSVFLGTPELPSSDGVLLHLWFLIILILFVLCAPALTTLQSAKSITLPQNQTRLFFYLAILIAVYSVFVRGFEELISRTLDREIGLVRVFLRYFPYFLLGILMRGSDHLWRSMHQINIPTILVGGILVALAQSEYGIQFNPLLFIAARAVLTVAIIGLLLHLFERFLNYGTPFSRLLSQGMYTAYLLQVCLIWIAGSLAISLGLNDSLLYIFVVVFTLCAGHLIWYFFVRPYSPIRFALTGRLKDKRTLSNNDALPEYGRTREKKHLDQRR